MKFRRHIAKFLIAITVIELILSSICRNENLVMAATDEVVQSEESVGETTENTAVGAVGEAPEKTGEESKTEESVQESETDRDYDVTEETGESVDTEVVENEADHSETEENTEESVEQTTESTMEAEGEETERTEDVSNLENSENSEKTDNNVSNKEESTESSSEESTEGSSGESTESSDEKTTENVIDEEKEDTVAEPTDDIEKETTENVEKETEEVTDSTTKDASKGAIEAITNSVAENGEEEEQAVVAPEGKEIGHLYANDIDLGTAEIPETLEELVQSTKTTYLISCYQDWLNLQALSKESTLEGYSFKMTVRHEGDGNNITNYNFVELNGSTSETKFEGIGTEEYPFSGRIYTDYLYTSITIKTDCALFQYLSTKANLDVLTVEPQGACAGLAENLIVENTSFEKLNSIIISEGAGGVSGNVAGGLFANVVNETGEAFVLQGTEVKVKPSVSGEVAGGLIGSMSGDLTLVMDGGIEWAPSVEALSTGSVVGGWIGQIDAEGGNIIIQGSESGVEYNFQGIRNVAAKTVGGLFGNVENATIEVESNLTFNLSTGSGYDLAGVSAGTFAGIVENSRIHLSNSIKIAYVRIKQGNNSAVTEKGIGGLIGVVLNSTIDSVTANGSVRISGLYVQNDTGKSTAHNIGGIAGYAKNSRFLFSQADCTVNNFTSKKTYGNAAGAIGLYEADGTMGMDGRTVIQNISVTGTSTVYAPYGNVAGLIGKINLAYCDVKVQNCYGENVCYVGTNIGLGIGAAVSTVDSRAMLRLSGVVLKGSFSQPDVVSSKTTIGGMVGYANVDLAIEGNEADGQFNTAVIYSFLKSDETTQSQQNLSNFGGLIGAVCQSGSLYRKVDVSNVLVGSTYFSLSLAYSSNHGGLFGRVEDKTSICLDGKIDMSAGTTMSTATTWQGTTISSISSLISNLGNTNFASVAGSINYSLIYLEPTGELITSSREGLDEIGNYGKVFRNGNWDSNQIDANGNLLPEANADPATWVIQNHQVTGAWKVKEEGWDSTKRNYMLEMETVGDFMRLAIFGNTCNLTGNGTTTVCRWGDGFYTTNIVNQSTGETAQNLDRDFIFSAILTADFYLESGTYDLRATGIECLYRNDEMALNGGTDNEGVVRDVASAWAQNSLICEEGTATIKYDITSCTHPNVGLFPGVNGTGKEIEFENLNLEYRFVFKPMVYNSKGSTYDKTIKQTVGGLSAKAKDNITITNVSYKGTIDDNKNPASEDRYMGGLIGKYDGGAGKIFSVNGLTGTFNCTYQHRNNMVGGVIAVITEPTSGKCEINLDSISLTGSILAEYTNNTATLYESAFITRINKQNVGDKIYADVNISNVTIADFSLGAKSTTITYPSIGGFLGYSWNCIDAELTNISVGVNGNASITAKAEFGGLLHDAMGKMSITNVTYGSGTGFDSCGTGEYCGLLVQYGQYLYLDVADYTIEEGVTVKNYAGMYFDEIVGCNRGGDYDECGGIVTIHKTAGTSFLAEGEDYDSYGYGYHVKDETGAYIKKTNYLTRYYYDLDQLDYSIDYTTIDSPEALMVWHIMHYANDYIIDYCLDGAAYGSEEIPTDYTISGTIDMTGYSIYPTSLIDQTERYVGNGAKIIFNAQAIYEGENHLLASNSEFVVKYPKDFYCQHSYLHAGLFNNIWNGVDVTGLTLSGTYSLYDYGEDFCSAGALVCGTIYGVEDGLDNQGEQLYKDDVKSNFNNITLDDLWCVNENGKLEKSSACLNSPIGLMIFNITSGANVNFDGIYMDEYTDDEVVQGYKAASALIGMVGDSTATYISMNFKNLDIMDAADGLSSSTLRSTTKEEVLSKASLIFYLEYKENCSAIYTFTSEDYLVGKLGAEKLDEYEDPGVVTLGQELGSQDYNGTNYAEILYYDNEDPVGMASDRVDAEGNEYSAEVSEIPFNCNNYLPYVCVQIQTILVNPKIADIKEGCGTYEDPYIISTTSQLITVYRYLYEEELYKEVLGMSGNEWKLHATGDDSYLCNGTEDDSSEGGHGELIPYEKERSSNSRFPTKEELSQAYYMITDDIDLSKYTEFSGFGRRDMPFIGVFVGGTESTNPTITMVEAGANSSLSQYAFIQNAKGVVVKDLTFVFNSTISIDSETGGIGAGVIATVLGGENIIDNVAVVSGGSNNCFSVQKENAVIGGYVGLVELGGVILRNVASSGLADFSVGVTEELEKYYYLGSVAGRVLDGYVVYDGSNDAVQPLFEQTVEGSELTANSLPLCSTYDILNGAYLKDSKVEWTGNGYKIADAKQLQIISMALNSGMLNYGATDSNGDSYGYASDSRQRKGNYNYVNKDISSDAAASEAYSAIVAGDNKDKFADSYLMQYFTDKTVDLSIFLAAAENSGLNPTVSKTGTLLTYELTSENYDMTVFGMGFRGLGARYQGTEYTTDYGWGYSTKIKEPVLLFQSNLIGSSEDAPAHITLDMTVTKQMDTRRAGLLNEVPNTGKGLLIQNIILSGNVKNEGGNFEFVEANSNSSAHYEAVESYCAGGFMSDSITSLRFENIKLDHLTVDATGFAGGLVAYGKEDYRADFKAINIELSDLTVMGGDDSREEGTTGGHAGGLIGIFQCAGSNGSNIYIGTEDGTDLQQGISGVTGNNVKICSRGRNNVAAAGLIGYLDVRRQERNSTFIFNSKLTNLTVYVKNAYKSSWFQSTWAGGVVGYSSHAKLCLDNIVIGSEDSSEHVYIALKGENLVGDEPVCVNSYKSGAGGFVAQSYANSSPYVEVRNSVIYGSTDSTGNPTTVIQGYSSVGGIIGKADKGAVTNCTVAGVSIKGVRQTGGCAGCIDSDSNGREFTLEDVTVENCYLEETDPQNGDGLEGIAGYIGGLLGQSGTGGGTHLYIKDCTVSGNTISSNYSRYAGGFVGQANQRVTISGDNTIDHNVIGGDIVGGVFGHYKTENKNEGMSNITISNNRIVSYMHKVISWMDNTSYRSYLAGGFAGKFETSAGLDIIENIVVKDNLIAGINTSNTSYIGGIAGLSYANTSFYNVTLSDNYMGIMTSAQLLQRATANWEIIHPLDLLTEDSVKVHHYFESDLDTFKDMLYAKTSAGTQTDAQLKLLSDASELQEEEYWKCSYCVGTIAGKLSASTGRYNTLVNVNIQYEDNTYRPLFDVGMNNTVSSTKSVYEKYRKQYFIVYDSMDEEQSMEDAEYLGFSNLKLIYDTYRNAENADKRYAYRLDNNYLAGEISDSISATAIYEATYYQDGAYVSDFVDENGNNLPLLIFKTTDNGTLDEVIQTYINMLTNDSGALNTYDQQDIEVTTTRKLLVDGVIQEDGATLPSVRINQTGNKFEFVNVAEDGTRLYDEMEDEKNASFTVITITYMYNDEAKWVLEIPIYVEQELEFDSHMRFTKGIEYDVSKVKAGSYVTPDSDILTGLDRGESYSLYLEYLYGEARSRYPYATIPKQLYMTGDNVDRTISFLVGTQMTLVDLENGGKPYYYIVDESDGNKIDFTKFKDSEGNSYVTRNINECEEYNGNLTFIDVCGNEKTNVAVETYLLLVDTSQVTKEEKATRGNAAYSLRTDISELENENPRLYSRIDYDEHCIIKINETLGLTTEFTNNYDLNGAISEGGNIALALEYYTKVSPEWQKANAGTPMYLDIAVSLEKTENATRQPVALPTGTQVYFEVQKQNSNGDLIFERLDNGYVIQGSGITDIYYYANSGSQIDLTTLTPDEDYYTTIRVILDFATADLSNFENASGDEEYGISADLVMGKESENPRSGEVRDSFYGTVTVNIASELGFSLEPKDLLTLGINQYQPGESDSGIMPFTAKIAFPDDSTLDDVQSKYYSIVYKIEEKTTRQVGIDEPLYELYTGSKVDVYLGDDMATGQIMGEYGGKYAYYKYCNMTARDLIIENNVAEVSFILDADDKTLDFSNYRLTGYLLISDTEIDNPVAEVMANDELNNDFFVYTIAKVKTDLN